LIEYTQAESLRLPENKNLPSTPMQNAINLITKYLKTKNNNIIENYTIDKSENTMKLIWDVKKKYENKSIK